MPMVKVTIGSEVKLCPNSCCSYTTEANLIQLHRKIKNKENVCRVHDFGSYSQGRGPNQGRGQNGVTGDTQKLLKQT